MIKNLTQTFKTVALTAALTLNAHASPDEETKPDAVSQHENYITPKSHDNDEKILIWNIMGGEPIKLVNPSHEASLEIDGLESDDFDTQDPEAPAVE